MIYNEYLFHKDNCIILQDSCIALAKEVEKRFTPWMDTWKEDYMTFAEGSPSTKLYEAYNVFLCHLPGFAETYNLVCEKFKEKENNYRDYAIAGWVNVYHQDTFLDWHKHGNDIHAHDGRWHGYVCVNAEPSKTLYKDDKGLVETIDNTNGYITLSHAGLAHRTTPWKDYNLPRITIAFDFIRRQQIDPMLLNRWIPIK